MGERRTRASREPDFPHDDGLVADTEAFLAGEFADRARRRDQVIPSWARLNRVAHGDLTSIRRARCPFPVKSATVANWHEEAWRTAERLLTDELLRLVGEDAGLLEILQRVVLVPLELQLIARETDIHMTALELLASTRAALRACMI